MAQKNYVSNKDESARLFQSSFLELFSHVHWSVPVIVYLPVIGYFMYSAMRSPVLSTGSILVLFIAGLATWTLTEYILHRYVFHYEPKSSWGKRLHFLMHGVHHDYPNDSLRLVMPPVISVPLATLFYILFRVVLGETFVLSFFAGFILGYLCYDMIHYGTHHYPMKGKIGLFLKHHHMRHHYQTSDLNYGVSSPVWDYVFDTVVKKEEPVSQS
jgi:sterol desaturase/sphingolipid hydroxylase (fatty acid hydroxylase superfamily)